MTEKKEKHQQVGELRRLLMVSRIAAKAKLPFQAQNHLEHEIASGHLQSVDSYEWREMRDDDGRVRLKPRSYRGDMRVTPEALADWVAQNPAIVADLFEPEALEQFAPLGTATEI